MIFGILLIVVAVLLITGYFDRSIRSVLNWCKSQSAPKKSEKKKNADMEKVEVEDDEDK